jgi:hypothetical protein
MGATTDSDLAQLLIDDDTHPLLSGVISLSFLNARRLLIANSFPGAHNAYARVFCQSHSFHTRVVPVVQHQCSWERLPAPDRCARLPIAISRNARHPANIATIELYVFSSTQLTVQPPLLLGSVSFHTHDLIRSHQAQSLTFSLFSGENVQAEVTVSIAFNYGLYGFGHSSQLRQSRESPDVALITSALPRLDPPDARVDRARDCLLVRQMQPCAPLLAGCRPTRLSSLAVQPSPVAGDAVLSPASADEIDAVLNLEAHKEAEHVASEVERSIYFSDDQLQDAARLLVERFPLLLPKLRPELAGLRAGLPPPGPETRAARLRFLTDVVQITAPRSAPDRVGARADAATRTGRKTARPGFLKYLTSLRPSAESTQIAASINSG